MNSAFAFEIDKDKCLLQKAWHSLQERTKYYNDLLERVAENLNFNLTREFLRVDYVMRDKEKLSVIFIESENDVEGASQEIDKLLCLSAYSFGMEY